MATAKKPQYAVNIRALRMAKGWTQYRLAMELNYSAEVIGNWERGVTVPDIFALAELAKMFKTSVDKLIGSE